MARRSSRAIIGAEPGEINSSELEVGVFASGSEGTDIKQNLPFLCFYNADTANHTLTAVPRAPKGVGNTTVPFNHLANGMFAIPTSVFASIKDGGANGNVYWFYSDVGLGLAGPKGAAGGGSNLFIASSVLSTAANNTTTSLTAVSTGFGFASGIKPVVSARIIGEFEASSLAATGFWQIYRNATGVPTNGTAVGTDTAIGLPVAISAQGGLIQPLSLNVVDTSPPGGTVYYYLAFYTGNNAQAVTLLAGITYNSTLIALYN